MFWNVNKHISKSRQIWNWNGGWGCEREGAIGSGRQNKIFWNAFQNFEKYLSKSEEICFEIKTNTYQNLDKSEIEMGLRLWERGYNWFRQAEENFWKPTQPDEPVQRWVYIWSKIY